MCRRGTWLDWFLWVPFTLLALIFNAHLLLLHELRQFEQVPGRKVRAVPRVHSGVHPHWGELVWLLPTWAKRSTEVTGEGAPWLGSWGTKSAFPLHSWNMYFLSWGILSCLEEFSSLLRSVSCGLWGFLSQSFSGSALFSSGFDVEITTDPNGSKFGTPWCHASEVLRSPCGAQALLSHHSQAPVFIAFVASVSGAHCWGRFPVTLKIYVLVKKIFLFSSSYI